METVLLYKGSLQKVYYGIVWQRELKGVFLPYNLLF